MGSGKTYWGNLLSEKLGMRFFDLDEQIASHAEKDIVALFESEGEEKFRMREKDALHIITESHESFIMSCGGGAPCFFNNIEYMNNAGTTVWINPPIERIIDRIEKEKEKRPLIKDLPTDQLKAFTAKKFADRKIFYQQASINIADDPIHLDELINTIFHA